MQNNLSVSYIPGLDGIRAIAVIMVIIFHYTAQFPAAFSNSVIGQEVFRASSIGWVGVDIFFVISGYLIATMLSKRPITSIEFYINFLRRRALRLLPAYFCCVIICLLLASSFVKDEKVLSNQYLLWTFTSNILTIFEQRSALWGANITLAHFWSLAVEWHFYILLPIILLMIKSLRALALLAVVTAIASRALLIYLHPQNFDNAIYSFSICRVDSLAIGVFLSTLPKCRNTDILKITGLLGAAAMFAMLLCIAHTGGAFKLIPWLQLFGYTAISTAFAMFLYYILHSEKSSRLLKALEGKFLTSVGRASYSLYLWHLPFYPAIIAITRSMISDPLSQFLVASLSALSVAIIAGTLSYIFLEKRFMYTRPKSQINQYVK